MSAVGRMTSADMPNKVITAMYPVAPACPTVAYTNATRPTARVITITRHRESHQVIRFQFKRTSTHVTGRGLMPESC